MADIPRPTGIILYYHNAKKKIELSLTGNQRGPEFQWFFRLVNFLTIAECFAYVIITKLSDSTVDVSQAPFRFVFGSVIEGFGWSIIGFILSNLLPPWSSILFLAVMTYTNGKLAKKLGMFKN
jgi:hypothetical protein